MSAEQGELRLRQAPQGSRKRCYVLRFHGAKMISRWRGTADSRICLFDRIPHSEVRPGVRPVYEFGNDDLRANTPNLVGGDINQSKYAMPRLDHTPEGAWIELQRGRGVAWVHEFALYRKVEP